MSNEKTGLKGWFKLECELLKNDQIPKETRVLMVYGALNAARLAEEITWEKQHEIFGNFVAKMYGMKVYSK